MKNEYLKNHLATIDLSFLKVVKDEVVEQKITNELKVVKSMVDKTNCYYNAKKEKADWSNNIEVLEDYFNNINTPKQPIKLNKCTIINDVSLFVASHLTTVRASNGKATFLPYLNRLQELKLVLTINSNKNEN